MQNLATGKIVVPSPDGKGTETVSLKDLGISYPVLINPKAIYTVDIDNPKPISRAEGRRRAGRRPTAGEPPCRRRTKSPCKRFDILVHFCWKPATGQPTDAEKAEKAEHENR